MMNRHRQGVMLLDTAIGLALIATVIAMLTAAASHQRRGGQHFALHRELVHEAETVLTALQQGRPAEAVHEQSRVRTRWLSAGEGDTALPWVEVRIERDGQSATLTGWAPPPAEAEGGMP
ncbi:MAG: hypothetical protein WD534_10680 [Phycisphaeraceae bacterium]